MLAVQNMFKDIHDSNRLQEEKAGDRRCLGTRIGNARAGSRELAPKFHRWQLLGKSFPRKCSFCAQPLVYWTCQGFSVQGTMYWGSNTRQDERSTGVWTLILVPRAEFPLFLVLFWVCRIGGFLNWWRGSFRLHRKQM